MSVIRKIASTNNKSNIFTENINRTSTLKTKSFREMSKAKGTPPPPQKHKRPMLSPVTSVVV